MNITPVNNSQPSFNGYVDKSVTKVIDRAFKNTCDEYIKTASNVGQEINLETIQSLKGLTETIKKKLALVMSKMHKNTALVLRDEPWLWHDIAFINEISRTPQTMELPLREGVISTGAYKSEINYAELNSKDLMDMNDFATKMIDEVDPAQIDKNFMKYKQNEIIEDAGNVSLLGRFKTNRQLKKLIQFMSEIGVEKELQDIFKNEVGLIQNSAKLRESFIKLNQKIVDSVSKGK